MEIVRRGLDRLSGEQLLAFRAGPKMKARGSESLVEGCLLRRVRRHGKLLGFDFGAGILTAHLRMTGRFAFLADPAARARLNFSSGPLSFLDQRGFATMEVIDAAAWPCGLGPDLWETDPDWRAPDRQAMSRRTVKAALLDQKMIAGIGNYLADESLWRCEVAPTRPCRAISPPEWGALAGAARDLSLQVLELGGTSIRDYVDTEGKAGGGAAELLAYGRAGQPCFRCGGTLAKDRVAGRGTTWCPDCQR